MFITIYEYYKYYFGSGYGNVNQEMNFNSYKKILELIPNNSEKIRNSSYYGNDIINCVKKYCESEKNNKFVVSLSGGVDSMVLITIIHYLGYHVVGAHINYNNRDETLEEQRFLENWCQYNNIKLYTKVITHITRANSKRSNYEFETKNIRFQFYKEVLDGENADTILLGHHKDDIIENIFANVCRGRYILDLAVIQKTCNIDDVKIARPLIDYFKTAIFDFAHENQIPYFKDTTPSWSVRGKFRNIIYPQLEDTFTINIKNNLLGLSRQSHEWNQLVGKEIIDPFMKNVKFEDNKVYFNIENYMDYPMCFWNIIFMKVFYRYGKNCPSRKGIQTFMNLIKNTSTHNVLISLANSCVCNLKNNWVMMEF